MIERIFVCSGLQKFNKVVSHFFDDWSEDPEIVGSHVLFIKSSKDVNTEFVMLRFRNKRSTVRGV